MNASPTPSDPLADARYCADAVRAQDSDRYLLALFLPNRLRRTAIALAAWNLELANARPQSGEAMLGMMRLQWHRDALAEIADGQTRRHPAIAELAGAVAAGLLHLPDLEAIVDGRERELEPAPAADLDELEAYARRTAGALNACLWPDVAAASDAGTAFGLIGLARAERHNRGRGRPWAPTKLSGDVTPIVEHGLTLAEKSLAAGPRAAVLPAAMAKRYGRRALKAGCDPATPAMTAPDPWRIWRLAAFRLFGK